MPETVIQAPSEPSFADIRNALSESPAPEPAKTEPVAAAAEPVTETPEPEPNALETPGAADGKPKEADPEPAAPEPEAIEEELPAGVKKRIAKEVQEQSRLDRLITEATSTTKAKRDKLAKLNADNTGSEPAPTTAPAASESKPVRPDLDTFPGTYAEYQKALNKYDADHEAWLVAKTERTVREQMTADRREESLKRDWDGATEEHGAEFPGHMKTLAAGSPEGLQLAISGLDNWSQVAVHLAKSPDELAALTAKWEANQYAAVAELGKLEARLQTESKPPEPAKLPVKAVKTLPPPPAKPGGAAAAAPTVDLETADQRTFNAVMKRHLQHR